MWQFKQWETYISELHESVGSVQKALSVSMVYVRPSAWSVCVCVVFAPPQRVSPGCSTGGPSISWPSSPLTGTAFLWPARWWEPTWCPSTPGRSCTLSKSAFSRSVNATAGGRIEKRQAGETVIGNKMMDWKVFTLCVLLQAIYLFYYLLKKTLLFEIATSCFIVLFSNFLFSHFNNGIECIWYYLRELLH